MTRYYPKGDTEMQDSWETYRQDVWPDRPAPEGDGWEPFAAQAQKSAGHYDHRGDPDDYPPSVSGEIVWGRRRAPEEAAP